VSLSHEKQIERARACDLDKATRTETRQAGQFGLLERAWLERAWLWLVLKAAGIYAAKTILDLPR